MTFLNHWDHPLARVNTQNELTLLTFIKEHIKVLAELQYIPVLKKTPLKVV